MQEDIKSKLSLAVSMFIFGTIGIFRTYIPLSSGFIAFARGAVGTCFLLAVILISRKKVAFDAIRSNLALLVLSGILIGFNWILLFEAYKYTTVATATLCYYMAPIFVIVASPFVFKERLTLKKAVCVAAALAGMVFVSGVYRMGGSLSAELTGVLFGLGAALLYASVILINKKTTSVGAYDKTVTQLASASAVLFCYVLIAERDAFAKLDLKSTALLILVGIIHTGAAYALYFGSMEKLSAQTVAIFSYIDPVVAIILSAVLLKDKMGLPEIIGAVMILGATFVSEVPLTRKKRQHTT